jgi:ATP-dependent DNA helicase RecQ
MSTQPDTEAVKTSPPSNDDRVADLDAVRVLEMPQPTPAELNAALLRHFGHSQFRPGQEAIVRSVLGAQPTLAILPTGGGKSLCYQLPALLLSGTTVVASPLVALMKDQVDQLCARGVAATFINSSISQGEQQERQSRLRRGELKIVYVAPERFRSQSFLSAISQIRVPLLAVDEAHCISSWGHDFRPDYARLQEAHGLIKAERILALTATATAEVRTDIAKALGLVDPKVFVAGFDRPNLFLESVRAAGDADKLARVTALARSTGPGLVYAATRRNVEKVVVALKGRGVDAIGYHAGMDDGSRSKAQDLFINNQCDVIVATNAFGMGVDKPDIRFVAHFDVPRTVEAWYQEIGRAGRDGKDSLALLLFNFADVMLQRRLIDGGRASEAVVRAALAGARRMRTGTIDALGRATGLTSQELQPALRILESAGHLERGWARGEGAEFSAASSNTPDAADLGIDFAMLERRAVRERRMLDRMVRLVDSNSCRRHELLRYFGDPDASSSSQAKCSACDNCVGSRAPAPTAGDSRSTKRDRASGSGDGAPARDRRAAPADESDEPIDPALFEALRTLRTALARTASVPPYVIFPDTTLRALCRERPGTQAAFMRVKGAGPARWDRYGEQVLEVIRKTPPGTISSPPPQRSAEVAAVLRRAPGASDSSPPRAAPTPIPPRFEEARERGPNPRTHEAPRPTRASEEMPAWLDSPPPFATGDLFDAASTREQPGSASTSRLLALAQSGITLAEIATKLNLAPADIASELASLASRGKTLDVTRLLGPDRFAAIRALAATCDGDLVAVKRRLNFPAAIGEIRLALL